MDDWASITSRTLANYDGRSSKFWEDTRDHDVQQNINALLKYLSDKAPSRILDFGCGPGRDLKTFRSLGHKPVGLEGSPKFVTMAREHSGCEVWEQKFLELNLPAGYFDGIFANASLFHVPSKHLPDVLNQLNATLKPGGVLFSSNPRGENQEGWNGERFAVHHDLASWRLFVEAAGFEKLEHYYRPTGLPFEQQRWLASVWRKPQ